MHLSGATEAGWDAKRLRRCSFLRLSIAAAVNAAKAAASALNEPLPDAAEPPSAVSMSSARTSTSTRPRDMKWMAITGSP